MKIVFKDLGPRKFSKIVEVINIIGYQNVKEFCEMEVGPHLPINGDFELVPTDGMPDLVANQYVVVYSDAQYVTRGMGTILVYH